LGEVVVVVPWLLVPLLSGGLVPVVFCSPEPGGGGGGESTIPLGGGVVDGVGTESAGTEFVTGKVDAVGELFAGFPFTLFKG
jgi:hypothetical protein